MKTRIGRRAALALLLVGSLAAWSPDASAQSERGEIWAQEDYSLRPRESVQFAVEYGQIPVRRWTLVVDGGQRQCDLSVLRVEGEELLYYETREVRHEVSIPWGIGEEIMVVVTARDHEGAFQVHLVGPPRDEVPASYSYYVNRALEDFAGGKNLHAEENCRRALDEDPRDSVAKVLLAGFLLDQQFYGQAGLLLDEALDSDLTGYMRDLATDLKQELIRRQEPLPEPVLRGVTSAMEALDRGDGEAALEVCDRILSGEVDLDGPSRGRFLTLRGRALQMLDRNFAALDAFTRALPLTRSKEGQAVVYFHMGQLYAQMENLKQAQGAYTLALDYGLPTGLQLQAREALQLISEKIGTGR